MSSVVKNPFIEDVSGARNKQEIPIIVLSPTSQRESLK